MAETFYGPWRVVLDWQIVPTDVIDLPQQGFVVFDDLPEQGFVVAGSDNADQRYVREIGSPLDLDVTGTEWTIDLQILWPLSSTARWSSVPVRRIMTFLPPEGLIVGLNLAPGVIAPFLLGMKLICTSTDPEINPIPSGNPYDFTIPED